MPHLFTNRPRKFNLSSKAPAGHRHFSWEVVNSAIYLIGGATFFAGSIFFFPQFEQYADWGAWIFFVGSLLYLIVTLHDMGEALLYKRTQHKFTRYYGLELSAAVAYIIGTLLFAVGSLLFLSMIGMEAAGGWCFIIGSGLFLMGAFVNVTQIIDETSKLSLQLVNATAISFALGSIIFLFASVPYLWPAFTKQDARKLFEFVAWQFTVGSVLFMAGGVFNAWRSYSAMRYHRAHRSASES